MSDFQPASEQITTPAQVAFFCMEFALANDFNIYSGGLGVLAGDYLYEADQQKKPLVAVGLYYSFAYVQQIDENGRQVEQHLPVTPEEAELELILDHEGKPITVQIWIQDRQVTIQAWLKKVGSIPLILLDTDIEINTPKDRHITDQLYAGDKEHRLSQEMVLGIGGIKMLHRLNQFPQIYHLNEGHATLLILQQISHFMQSEHISYEQAVERARSTVVFTNHTLIPAGNDVFNFDLLTIYFSQYAQEIGVPVQKLLEMGHIADSSVFSMTMLGLRYARKTNAVSKYHAEKAKDIWANHPMEPITNGIYIPRWYAPEMAQSWPLQADHPPEPHLIWQAHQEEKRLLADFIKRRLKKDISDQSLILSWARRFVKYKRPLALFWQLDWLDHIISAAPVPIHFFFSGKVHPHDTEGKEAIAAVIAASKDPRFAQHITFIPNYNLEVASYLTRGSDVWLNTPLEGYEACGTSGMKAALNGVLQCSTNDGWMREVGWKDIAWILNDQHISESLYSTLENEIIPLYQQRDKNALPQQWIERMIASSQIIRDNFQTQRMMNEYWSMLYGFPAA